MTLIVPVPNARTLVNPEFAALRIPHVTVLLLISNVPLPIIKDLVDPIVNASCSCHVAVDCGVLGPIVIGTSIVTPAVVIVLVPEGAANDMAPALAVKSIPEFKVRFPYITEPPPFHVPVNPVKFRSKT